MTILLLVLIGFCWIVCLRSDGIFSLWSALLLGITAYSVPVIIGYYLRLQSKGLEQTLVSVEASQLMLWAWAWMLVFLLLFRGRRAIPGQQRVTTSGGYASSMYDSRSRVFCLLCIAASCALYTWIALVDSPFYFLAERQIADVAGERQKLLWKWVNLFGLISAIMIRSRTAMMFFFATIAIYFVAGDRTMILISGVAVAIYFFQGERDIRRLLRFDLLLLVAVGVVAILLGKPIYHAVKIQSTMPLELLLTPKYGSILMSFFEPLLTHNILEDVIRSGFTYSWVDVARGVVGQVLIVPSAFGIDSSAFNVQLQQSLYPRLEFGIANHYFAQGWSLGGWFGVAIFSFLLVFMTSVFGTLANRSSPLPRIMFLTMGVVVGTYFFRNSLENIFSMLRQIFLVGAFLLLATQLCVPAAWRKTAPPLFVATGG